MDDAEKRAKAAQILAARASGEIPGTRDVLIALGKREADLVAVRQNLSSLNEIVAEIAHTASHEQAWIALVVKTLRECSWALGFEFQGERPDAEWLERHG